MPEGEIGWEDALEEAVTLADQAREDRNKNRVEMAQATAALALTWATIAAVLSDRGVAFERGPH